MGLNAVRYSREAFCVYWNAVFAKMTLRPGVAEFWTSCVRRALRWPSAPICWRISRWKAGVPPALPTRWITLSRVRKPVWISRVRRFSSGWRCTNAAVCRRRPSWLATTSRTIFRALDVGIDGVWLNWTDKPETGRWAILHRGKHIRAGSGAYPHFAPDKLGGTRKDMQRF